MSGRRILVVDDDETFRFILREALRNNNYDVQEASNGEEARAKLDSFLPEMILLDILMPGLDGISLCHEIRSRTASRSVPVLVMSALVDRKTMEEALSAGATDYIVKPISLSDIQRHVEEAFQKSDVQCT